MLCEDASIDYPGARQVRGRAAVAVFLRRLMMRFDRLAFSVVETISQGERICIVWRNEGALVTGEPFENRGATIVHLQNGRIVALSDYFKADVVERPPPSRPA